MSLIADKGFRYAGKQLAPGEPFTPRSERDARILKAIRKASDAPALPGEDADPAEVSTRNEVEASTKRKRGSYQRRDMRAEG